MKIPKKLKIGAHTFTVEFVDKINDQDPFGTCEQGTLLIQFKNGLPATQLEGTLLHEVLHAINYNLTEEQVEYIANGLIQVIHDNKLTFTGK